MLGSIWHPRFPRERAGRGAQAYPRLAERFKLMLHREAKNCRCTRGGGGRQRFQTEGLDRDGCISSATSTAGCSEGRLKVGFDGCPETPPDACRDTPPDACRDTPPDACRDTPPDACRDTPQFHDHDAERRVHDFQRPDYRRSGHAAFEPLRPVAKRADRPEGRTRSGAWAGRRRSIRPHRA